jgi:spore germination protein GerM
MMTRRNLMIFVGFMAAMGILAFVLAITVPRWIHGPKATASAAAPAQPIAPGRRIKARFFYVADDGARLTSVERDVAYGEGTVEQARQIIEAQIAPVDQPLVSALPPATKLRAIFVTEQGEAFVDFSRELATGHSGGSTDEILTVYTIVSALTVNLPAVKSVQLLIEGKQIETLAGHVDLRRPLESNPAWIQ